MNRRRKFLCLLLIALGVPIGALAQSPSLAKPASSLQHPLVLKVDPAQSTLHFSLSATAHTVHGTFAIKSGELRFGPGAGDAGGQIVADATSGKTGNDSRDKNMHSDVLQSARYPEIVFRLQRVEGSIPAQGSATVTLIGTFLVHGAEHPLSIPVQAEITVSHWKGTAAFTVPYVEWGLKNPSNFLLKVSPSVDISLDLSGTLSQ